MNGARNNPRNKPIDVLVIGAGVGGLVCATELARQGANVQVFEKEAAAGGCARHIRHKGYHFDVSLHHTGGYGPGRLTHGCLDSLGVFDKLTCFKPDTLFTADFPGMTVTLPNDRDGIIAELSRLFPEEKDGIIAVLEVIERIKDDVINPTIERDFNTPMHERISGLYLDSTFEQFLKQYIRNEYLHAILGQMWMYIGLPPSHAAANFSACVNSSILVEGEYSIVGGGAALVRSIVERLRELGGRVHTGKGVKRIMVSHGRAEGVVLENGESVSADIVVSATNPHNTFSHLMKDSDVSEVFRYRLQQMTPSLSMYAVYIGLDCPCEQLGVRENLFVNHSVDLDVAFENVLKGNLSKTDYCVHNSTQMKTSVAPDGCGIVTFLEPAAGGDLLTLSDGAYQQTKDALLDVLLNKYEHRFPGLRQHAVVVEFLTPRSFGKTTQNPGGAVYGFAQSIEQSGHRRLKNRTPVHGLYLSGAWTSPGGGYEGAIISGIETANTIIKETGSTRKAPPVGLTAIDANGTERHDETSELAGPPLIVFDDNVQLDFHYRHSHPISVYGDDLNSRGNADASAYLRYMDRARTEAIESICGEQKNWLSQYQLKVYRIEARLATIARLGDTLDVRTGIRKISDYRASFDQRIIHQKRGKVVADAAVEVLFLDNADRLVPVPADFVNTDEAVPDFSVDRRSSVPFSDDDLFPFRSKFRVYFEDTDLQSIMFHVSYVRFCERAMFDVVRTTWPDQSTNQWMNRTNATVSRIDIRYLKAAVMGDRLEVRTILLGMNAERLFFGQRIVKLSTHDVLADAVTDIDFRDAHGKAYPVPSQVADVARAHLDEMKRVEL